MATTSSGCAGYSCAVWLRISRSSCHCKALGMRPSFSARLSLSINGASSCHSCMSWSMAGNKRVPMASCRRPKRKTTWSVTRIWSSLRGGAADAVLAWNAAKTKTSDQARCKRWRCRTHSAKAGLSLNSMICSGCMVA